MENNKKPKTYNRGDAVEEEGNYVCVPCGFKGHFQPGDTFSECTSCLGGTDEGHDDYAEGLELWEKVLPVEKEKDEPLPPPKIDIDEEVK